MAESAGTRTALGAGFWILALGLTFALSIVEWFYFAAVLRFEIFELTAWESAVVFWCIWVKSLLLLLPVAAVAHLLLFFRLPRIAWIATAVLAGLVFAYLLSALFIHFITGNPVTMYIPYIIDPLAWKWGGGVWAVVGGTALLCGVAGLATAALLFLSGKLGAALARYLGRRRLAGMLAWSVVALLAGVVPSQYLFRQPVLLEHLWDAFPANYGPLARIAVFPLREQLDERLTPIYARYLHTWEARPIDTEVRLRRTHLPDVVVFLVESLRDDVLAPSVMPNLHRHSLGGMRFAHHYAGGNRSELGFFALFYSRSPLQYFETIGEQPYPQANRIFADSGYESILLASADLAWQRIDEWLGESSFDQVMIRGTGDELNEGDWVAHDRATLASAVRILGEPRTEGRPRFLVVYLMATHFNYDYPPELERFKPSAPRTIWHSPWQREQSWNRYRNAAAFIDHELDRFLQAIELEHSVVVITSDHGESIYDDGTFSHGSRLSEAQTRVPLIILGADVPPGRRIERMTSHVDVLPTLLHVLAGGAVAVRGIHGRDQLGELEDPDDLMLVGTHGWTEKQVVLIRGGERLALRIGKSAGELHSYGFVDENAWLIPRELPEAELAAWAECFERHLRR